MESLYYHDHEAWLSVQINALKQEKINLLDVTNLIEELEQLNKSNKRELYSYLVILLAHLLKWQYQPKKRKGGWEASIFNSRNGVKRVIADQPSLNNYLTEILPVAYKESKKVATKETMLDIQLFPTECPYSLEELLEEDWVPY